MSEPPSPEMEAKMAEMLAGLELTPCRPIGAHNQSAGDCALCREARGEITFQFATTEPDPTPLERLAVYEAEWLWHEGTEEVRAGYGPHMSQMLYRLPRDGQTVDMQASIEAMLADLRTALGEF